MTLLAVLCGIMLKVLHRTGLKERNRALRRATMYSILASTKDGYEEFPSTPDLCPYRLEDVCTCPEGECVEIEWYEEDAAKQRIHR